MDTGAARAAFEQYRGALVYIEVEDASGDVHMGSGFHVGEGVFVTARHVLEDRTIREIGSTERTTVPVQHHDDSFTVVVTDGVEQRVHTVRNGVLKLLRGPYFHPDDAIDVAVFQVDQIDPLTPVVQLGSHLDDWLSESDFVLTEAVILGYPPIPKAKRPSLVGTRAEVSATIDRYDTAHVHFVFSAMARGGFSGGLALSEYGYALGMVTSSLVADDKQTELGYMAAIGVEPLYVCLAQHKLLPDCQADGWDGLWNTNSTNFCREVKDNGYGGRSATIVASVGLLDDGKRLSLEVMCNDAPDVLAAALDRVSAELTGSNFVRAEVRPGFVTIAVEGPYDLYRDQAHTAARSVIEFMKVQGYLVFPSDSEID